MPFETWKQQVAETRAQGFGIDESQYISGVTVVAAPVWKRRGNPSHALVAIGISSALKRDGTGALGQALLSGAAGLSGDLSGG
jgi:DNA-binding IclR family transcriptional regulator